MSNTKRKTPTAVEAAQKNLAEVRSTISAKTEEVTKLEQEHHGIEEQIESGSLVADIDRKAELEELIGRRKTRLEDLEGRALAHAEHALAQAELDKFAGEQAGGVVAKHAEYLGAADSARAKVTEGIAELKAATSAWEEFSSPIIRRAAAAGLTAGKADPLARVLVAGTGDSAHLIVDGEEFTVPGINGAVSDAVSGADDHLAGTIARGLEARKYGLTVAEIGH